MNKLVYPPDASSYAVDDAQNRLSVNYGVAGLFRRDLLNADRLVNVGWQVSADIYAYLSQVYRWFINTGGEQFLCDLELDEIDGVKETVSKFVPGSFKLTGVSGETYNVSAQFKVTPPKYDVVNKPWISDTGLQRIVMSVGKGAYVLTGRPVDFHLSHIHAQMPTGVYHLTGRSANFAKVLAPQALQTGIYILTGYQAELSKARIAVLDKGVYLITGQDVDLTYVPGVPFSPLDLPNLYAWFDASDPSTITISTGTQVSQLNDKSGNGHHATQATSGAQMRVHTAGLGVGLNSLQENSGTAASFMAFPQMNLDTEHAIFFIGKPSGGNSPEAISTSSSTYGELGFGSLGGSGGGPRVIGSASASLSLAPGNGTPPLTIGPSVIGNAGASVIAVIWDGINYNLYQDGSLIATTTGILGAGQFVDVIGKYHTGFFWTGDWGEAILVYGTMTSTEIIKTFAYLRAKWGTA